MKIRHLLLAAVSLNAEINTYGMKDHPVVQTALRSIKSFVRKIEGEIESFYLLYFGKMKDEIFSEFVKAGQYLKNIDLDGMKDKVFGAFNKDIGNLKDDVLKTVLDLKTLIIDVILAKAFAAAIAMHLDINLPSGVNFLLNKPEVPVLMPALPGMPGLPNGIEMPAFNVPNLNMPVCTCGAGLPTLTENTASPLATPEAKLASLQIPETPKPGDFSNIKFDALKDLKDLGFLDSVIRMIADIENSVMNPIETLKKLLQAITTEVARAFETVINGLTALFDAITNGFKSALNGIMDEAANLFKKFKEFFAELPSMLFDIIDKYLLVHKILIARAINYFVKLIKKVIRKLFKAARAIKSAAQSL